MSELTKFIIILLIQVYLSVTIDHLYLDPHEPIESMFHRYKFSWIPGVKSTFIFPFTYILIISSRFMLK